AADVLQGVVLQVDELMRPEVERSLPVDRASGPDYVATGFTCQLHHDRPDRTCRAVRQHALSRLKTAVLEQALPRSQTRDRQARADREVDFARQWRKVARLDGRVFGQGAIAGPVGETEHSLSHRESGRSIAKRG